jgi:hypothetical protein
MTSAPDAGADTLNREVPPIFSHAVVERVSGSERRRDKARIRGRFETACKPGSRESGSSESEAPVDRLTAWSRRGSEGRFPRRFMAAGSVANAVCWGLASLAFGVAVVSIGDHIVIRAGSGAKPRVPAEGVVPTIGAGARTDGFGLQRHSMLAALDLHDSHRENPPRDTQCARPAASVRDRDSRAEELAAVVSPPPKPPVTEAVAGTTHRVSMLGGQPEHTPSSRQPVEGAGSKPFVSNDVLVPNDSRFAVADPDGSRAFPAQSGAQVRTQDRSAATKLTRARSRTRASRRFVASGRLLPMVPVPGYFGNPGFT